MSTLKQIDSARRNGAKSRGPVTDEGKAKSSLNSTRHGLFSTAVVLANEDPAQFEQLKTEYWNFYKPQTQPERDFVMDIVNARWRLNRVLNMETALLDAGLEGHQEEETPELQTARTFQGFVNYGVSLKELARHETRLRRIIEKATKDLRQLQKERKIENEPEPVPVKPQPQPRIVPQPPPTPEPAPLEGHEIDRHDPVPL